MAARRFHAESGPADAGIDAPAVRPGLAASWLELARAGVALLVPIVVILAVMVAAAAAGAWAVAVAVR